MGGRNSPYLRFTNVFSREKDTLDYLRAEFGSHKADQARVRDWAFGLDASVFFDEYCTDWLAKSYDVKVMPARPKPEEIAKLGMEAKHMLASHDASFKRDWTAADHALRFAFRLLYESADCPLWTTGWGQKVDRPVRRNLGRPNMLATGLLAKTRESPAQSPREPELTMAAVEVLLAWYEEWNRENPQFLAFRVSPTVDVGCRWVTFVCKKYGRTPNEQI